MEFTIENIDKKIIQKQDIGLNPLFIENNLLQIEKILSFLNTPSPLLLVNGFMGTGKTMVVNQALSFLKDDVITLKYNCFETTILDDILLEFFDCFKKLTAQGIIQPPKAKSENFTQKINAYFTSIDKPLIIVLNSFEQILKDKKEEILDFLFHLSKSYKIKTILIGRKFDYDDFKQNYQKVAISALDKNIFEKYLREEGFKQIGPLSDELYKYSRGYWFYTSLAIKIMQIRKLSLAEFLSGYTKSFQTFNDFILREGLSLVDPVSGHLFRFLTIMRHPVNVKLLKTLNLYDADRIAYFVDNKILNREGSLIYLQDYYKIIAENSVAENILIKIHKSCVKLYETQLPLKPLERDLLISRQTMRKEIEYHSLYIPKKPQFVQKEAPQVIQAQTIQPVPQTLKEKDDQIKNISFVFESEANEMAIMNKIANSINKFVDISDKKSQVLEEIQNQSLIELINQAKTEEQNFEYTKAVMIYQKALTMNTDDDYYTFLPLLYTKIALALKKLSDWFNSLKYFELAEEFYISTGDIEKINECKFEIANIYYITFKREKAEKLLQEILSEDLPVNLKTKAQLLLSGITGKWIEEIPDDVSQIEKPVLAELYFKYALNFDENADIENAVKYYKKCVETSQDVNINLYLSSALANLATIYDENGKTDLAMKYLNESLRLDELTKNYNGIYSSSMKLGEVNIVKNPEKALEYFKRANICAKELDEPAYIASSGIAIADFYYNKNDFDNALKFCEEAKKYAQNSLSKEVIRKIDLRINSLQKAEDEK